MNANGYNLSHNWPSVKMLIVMPKMYTKTLALALIVSGQISPSRKLRGGRSRTKMRSTSESKQFTKLRPYSWPCAQKVELKDGSKSRSSLDTRAASAPSKLLKNLL